LEKKLTTYLLTKNNENTIDLALSSILWLNGDIIVGDIGSTDKTLKICKKYNVEVIPIIFQNDYSAAKNKLLNYKKSLWQLYLEPWEQIITGHRAILNIMIETRPVSYYLQILSGQTIAKEIRLWNKNLRFSNPIFESISDKSATLIDSVIIHSKKEFDEAESEKLLEDWKNTNPISNEPYYYQAYQFLRNNKYQEFISLAEQYTTISKKGPSAVMIRYHLAMINLYVFSNFEKSIKNILECIATRPIMAEFWCLLGDIYYKLKEYKKAISFYENAIILGKKRLKDEWPIEIPKYDEYPKKMISSCQEILKNYQRTSNSLTTTVT
jgi:tetratricopeptide (TPR) repeat protein